MATASNCPQIIGLLRESSKIRRIISDSYPIIILDEFQDINKDEWSMIQLLGEQSSLTRAKNQVTILTPRHDPSPILF